MSIAIAICNHLILQHLLLSFLFARASKQKLLEREIRSEDLEAWTKMASVSLDLFVGKLISALENEASSLTGVSNEIEDMKHLLNNIRSFLVDADKVGESSERQKAWVASVRDIAYPVENIIDEFMYNLNRQRQWSVIHRTLRFPKDLLVRHKVAAKLQDIKKRMNKITERAHQFGVQQLEERGSCYDPNWKNRLSESSLFFKDDDLVGIREAQHELLGWLMDEKPRRTVISVVGMGGSGKTTLVANTFNKQRVKQHFDFCTWITVSKQYVIEELFRSMVKEVYKQTNEEVSIMVDTMSYKVLVETLVQYLQPRRYLIVLDDVWSIRFWQEINIALPEGMCGSRVMVTTRREDAVPFQSGFVSYVHQIRPLKMIEAWNLFCKKAFPNERGGCPSDLDSLARKLVEKCEGLPLAIVALGGLMSSKKSIAEWRGVYDNLNWELSNNAALELVKAISLLSYHDLSFRLKQCFLYCCMFPEDYAISRKRLIRLWMAEGFLEQVKDVPPEAVAESYLTELISRSLLQVVWRNYFGRPKAFKMHDLIREFALIISKEEKLVAVSDGKTGVEENGIHRYSIEVKDKEMKPGNGTSQLRSLIIFVVDEILKSSFNKLPSGFKLLKVLDLENAPIIELPSDFGHLFNLRYLNLTRTKVKVLPKSIGKLFNLQTLHLKDAKIKKLPNEIVKLQNLRHLRASYLMDQNDSLESTQVESIQGIFVPPNIFMLKSLQVLSYVTVMGGLNGLEEMTQLTRLGLDGLTEAHEQDLCSAIAGMERLHHLSLTSGPQASLKVDALLSAPPYLEKLLLIGKLEKVPHWFDTLLNLKYLNLQNSQLREDALSHIQVLPNLLHLDLLNAFQGECLCFVEGFQKLKILTIVGCPQLKEIVIEKGMVPGLQGLKILECKQFRRLPLGWEHLSHLKEVALYDISEELVEALCRNENGDLPTMPYIFLARTDGDDNDEAKPKWVLKILN
ncbi:disease resistance protein RPM1-like isoform X2 [Durio zibethinus]|uniref:Disease resistance protein RPM1-like isoform X2 n=1 Tax=Durio zibethinus TaxID=66656 RepID=A0A6P5XUN6_DURZI|nr:disease resistance protein RPM1-like isoform X2 [Durio zibethinus]